MLMGQNPNQHTGSKASRNWFTNRLKETERFLELVNGPQITPLPLQMFYAMSNNVPYSATSRNGRMRRICALRVCSGCERRHRFDLGR